MRRSPAQWYNRRAGGRSPADEETTVRIIRFVDRKGREHFGAQVDETTARLFDRSPLDGGTVTGATEPIATLLAPCQPPAIFAIGLNYRRHAQEVKAGAPEFPVVFLKAPGSLQHPNAPIVLPHAEPIEVDYEVELTVVIGRTAKNVPRGRALEYVLGYTCANDVSGRRWQIRQGGTQWCRGKSFDTFCPLGPAIVTTDDIPDPNTLGLRTIINGETLQDWNTDDMIFDVPSLVSFVSEGTTLAPGTVILTGTPHGVGFMRRPKRFLKVGDRVVVEIDKIGRLENPVAAEG
ncbi:MAG: fumarylacetoacetate hydrolase family protein [Vicinamibacterales bacterium]|nr:fumarylacetoacetate hydrolase family protein [Vicinamibacterales bacterium]HJO38585.1 fumarylacetoacetate hydrolase family protein [Vicinamibacterales bacterium]